ncbi:hypothetical protein J6590_083807 [Homalodisca vitripennis]|nr:hypothetical protein J6590_083807 [Homalodisca vitripennis]
MVMLLKGKFTSCFNPTKSCNKNLGRSSTPSDSCSGMFKTLRILTVASLYIVEETSFALNFDMPRREDNHEHYIKRANDLDLPVDRTTLYTKNGGARSLTVLSPNIKNENQDTFKKLLANILVEMSMYTI